MGDSLGDSLGGSLGGSVSGDSLSGDSLSGDSLSGDSITEARTSPSPTVTSVDAASADPDETDFELVPRSGEYFGTLGRYEVEREIARGGMGVILLARDDDLGRKVAIKLILKSHQGKPDLCSRFIEEARVTGQLQHPGIVPIYDMGQAPDGRPFFAMKWVKGQTLAGLLAEASETTWDRSRFLKILEQVCQTLAFAHSQGVIHLDLKPANVMVGAFGEVHVMDWGLSRVKHGSIFTRSGWIATPTEPPSGGSPAQAGSARVDPAEGLVQRELPARGFRTRTPMPTDVPTTRINGTPAYMAPEQARGDRVDARSDVFGLGAVLCEILTGSPPYRGHDIRQVYGRAANAALNEAISGLESCSTDDTLVSLAKWCLSPNPSERPADAGVVAQELTNYLESALEQAESDLGRFFELSDDLFCIASLDGYFKRVNQNFYRVLGYAAPQLVTRPFLEFIHPEDCEETRKVMQRLATGKPVSRFRNRYREASGRYRLLEWTAKPIPAENIIFAVARDVTEEPGVGSQ